MLSGEYNFLIDHMWLTDIIAVVLLIIPIFLIFYDNKWIFGYYVTSIVANLPLIFYMRFKFSYEAIIALMIIIVIIRDIIRTKELKYYSTKEGLELIFFFLLILLVNIFTSFFNFNKIEVINRIIIYGVNLFILFIFTYYMNSYRKIKVIRNGFIFGALLLICSMIIEMIYGYYILGVANMRPAGLLLDPNVCAFALNLSLIISFIKNYKTNVLYDLFIIFSRVIIVFAIFLTVSRSAYIGTIFILSSLIIYYSKGKRRWIALSTVVVFIIMYLIFFNIIKNFIDQIYSIIDLNRIFPTPKPVPNEPPTPGGIVVEPDYSNSRITLIKAAFTVFINNFVVGAGAGNVPHKIYLITNMKMNAHNLLLQLLAESGIFMLATILIFLYFAFKFIMTIKGSSKFIIFLFISLIIIESMFNHNLLNINIFYIAFAIILSLVSRNSRNQKTFSISKETLRLSRN